MTKRKLSVLLILLVVIGLMSVSSAVSEEGNEEVNATNNETTYKPFVDPRVLEQFNISSEIPVIVKVRDVSGISISSKDSIEQQNIKDLQRKEFLGNKTDSVLSKLPADGFKLKGKFLTGRGFYGNITKAVFDKLVNDSDVGSIYLDSVSYVGGWRVTTEEEIKSDEAAASANATIKNIETNFSENKAGNETTYIIRSSKSEKSLFHKLISFLKSLLKFK